MTITPGTALPFSRLLSDADGNLDGPGTFFHCPICFELTLQPNVDLIFTMRELRLSFTCGDAGDDVRHRFHLQIDEGAGGMYGCTLIFDGPRTAHEDEIADADALAKEMETAD